MLHKYKNYRNIVNYIKNIIDVFKHAEEILNSIDKFFIAMSISSKEIFYVLTSKIITILIKSDINNKIFNITVNKNCCG